MEFPKRALTHISESASWKILQNSLPPEWIIRDVTERDYGVDCYVEIVWKDHEVTGDLCSIQLKSTEKIEWNLNQTKWGNKSRFSGIKKSIVNYWMNLPVPVFLMWAETSTGNVFFAPVKDQVRSQYPEYLDKKQKTLGFDFYSDFAMGSSEGKVIFFVHYLKEKSFDQFSTYLTGLLTHWNEYYEFIIANQNRDCFLEVEVERQLLLIHVYRTCKFLSQFLGVEWKVIDLAEAYKEDRKTWKDSYWVMHEMTLDRILSELQPVYIDILEGAREFVVNRQKDYWIQKDYLLFTMCLNLRTEHMRRES
ncbi:MAG: DUF4365 domain-containing protein [Candidatus Hodarchaeota archaeon]